MARKTHRRLWAVVAASVVFHAGLLAVLAFQRPAAPVAARPSPVFEVTIVPRYLVEPKPRTRQVAAQTPIRPRAPRQPPAASPVAPLYVPPAAGPPAQGPAVGVSPHPAPQPPGTQATLSQALRGGGVGCPNPDAVGLTRAERDRCAERLGAGAKTAAFRGLGLSREKQALLDQAAAHQEACRKYREGMPPGLASPSDTGMPAGLGSGPSLRGGLC